MHVSGHGAHGYTGNGKPAGYDLFYLATPLYRKQAQHVSLDSQAEDIDGQVVVLKPKGWARESSWQ